MSLRDAVLVPSVFLHGGFPVVLRLLPARRGIVRSYFLHPGGRVETLESASAPTVILSDNLANVRVAHRMGSSTNSRHFLIRYECLHQRITDGQIRVLHVRDPDNPSDFLTKFGLPALKFKVSCAYASGRIPDLEGSTIAHSTTDAAATASPTQAAVPSPSHPDTDPSAWRSSSASRILSPDTEALAAQAVCRPDGRLTEPDLRMFTCRFPP